MIFFKVKEGELYQPEDGLQLEAVDIHLMSIDSGAETEFDYKPEELIPLYEENPDLMESRMGSIHSHNNMKAFFSGTDMEELRDGSDTGDFYLMLVVNNTPDEWVAKIGLVVEVESIWEKIFTFKNNQSVKKTGKKTESDYINYDLEIAIPSLLSEENRKSLDKRISAIREAKVKKRFAWERDDYPYATGRGWGTYSDRRYGGHGVQTEIGFNSRKKKEESWPPKEKFVDLIATNGIEYFTVDTAIRAMAKEHAGKIDEYWRGLRERIKEISSSVDETIRWYGAVVKAFRRVNNKFSREVADTTLREKWVIENNIDKVRSDGEF